MPYIKQKAHQTKKKVPVLLLIVIAAVVVAGGAVTVYLVNKHNQKPAVTASQNTKGEPAATPATAPPANSSSTSDKSTSGTSQPGDNKSNSDSNSQVTLVDPTGDFVSAHHIKLDSPISSVCNTTTAASCTIKFVSNGVTKSLKLQTTDRGGSTYWDWKAKDIGLTAGTWQISAVATLGSQTKTTADATSLEVSE